MTFNNPLEPLFGKKAPLSSLLEYQTQAVVSKTLVKEDNATVTLFAFDRGESLSEHSAPFDAILYVVEGVADITIAGRLSLVKEGEIIVLPANQAHALKANQRFKMLLIMIKVPHEKNIP